jgi:hypothetical protein
MRSFLLHAALFGTLVLLGIGGYFRYNRHFLPAPRVTSNEVLNMKLSHLRHRGATPAHVLAIGSSMTMNNLSSAEVMAHFGDTSFVNMGAWGVDMVQSEGLAEVLVPMLKPHTVLVVSNLNDLVNDGRRFHMDTTRVVRYLRTWGTTESYLRNLKPAYYLREMERNRIRMHDRSNYEFMGVDEHGGAGLVIPRDRIDPQRWARKPPLERWLADEQYLALERLCAYLGERGIRLIFLQSPYRDGVRNSLVDRTVETHLARVSNILAPYDHILLTATDRPWPDSLFVDFSHLNGRGAELFTRHVLGKLDGAGGTTRR